MLNAMKKVNNVTHTENGAVSNASTLNACLDFFSLSGALRNVNENRILQLFTRAFADSPDYAMRALFYTRDVRGGCGERRVFRIILRWLANTFPDSVIKNIGIIPEYGRFDDILVLLGTPCEKAMIEFISKTLKDDEEKMSQGKSVSLMAKWLPSVNASNPERKRQAGYLASKLKMRDKQYRKRLSALKRYLDILETRLCERDYTFCYEKQPANAMYKYRNAFLRNDNKRYLEFIQRVNNGVATLKAGTIYPYQIIMDAAEQGLTREQISILDATWNSLPDYGDCRNAIAVVDGSGSMEGEPISIAVSLGMYFAERNKGHFANHFITFSESPRLVEIHGNNIVEKTLYCMSYNEVANTDLMRVFGLILEAAITHNLPQSELPEVIYVISDMEFDRGVCESICLHEEVKLYYEKLGYKLPKVVYWNVSSHQNQYPVASNEYGAVLVSGSSPSIFNMVISGEVTPESFMKMVLDNERYGGICA